jgi:hypothetical protein
MCLVIAPGAGRGTGPIDSPKGNTCDGKFERELSVVRDVALRRLASLPSPVALYGVTSYSQAFLGEWPDFAGIDRIFDDTEEYWGERTYGPMGAWPITGCREATLSSVRTVIISAYLHDGEIAKKLRALAFRGEIVTLRRGETPENLQTLA